MICLQSGQAIQCFIAVRKSAPFAFSLGYPSLRIKTQSNEIPINVSFISRLKDKVFTALTSDLHTLINHEFSKFTHIWKTTVIEINLLKKKIIYIYYVNKKAHGPESLT